MLTIDPGMFRAGRLDVKGKRKVVATSFRPDELAIVDELAKWHCRSRADMVRVLAGRGAKALLVEDGK